MLNFNSKKHAYIKGDKLTVTSTLLAKLIEYAHQNPSSLAIETTNETWNYEKLYAEVLIWKNRIRKLNLNGPTIVCLHRTPRLLAILLAMQWLEIAYIPIEITTPTKRIKAIIEDSKAQAILHDTINAEEFIILPCNVYDIHNLINNHDDDYTIFPQEELPKPNQLVYIIYTSGSTGNPKGVSITNKALNNFLASISEYLRIENTMLACTTIAFDISYLELYLPIWQGKSVFIANQTEHKDPEAIKQIFNTYQITTAQGTPSFWNMLVFSGWDSHKHLTILSGGEPLKPKLINNLLPKVKEIWNLYGPTEATIWCAAKKITNSTAITVGKPLHNLEMLILDSTKKIVPIGTKGQLYISGIALADGYYNHPRLTEEKFTTMKIGLHNKRVYNTGDIALLNANQEIEIFGRIDNQIKLHGYRIELEDIEAHIQTNIGVRECVVGVHNEQLIAYICINSNGDYSEDGLKKQLQLELSEFMIPKRFIYLDKIPINSSGKLDRKALSLPNNNFIAELNAESKTCASEIYSSIDTNLNNELISANAENFQKNPDNINRNPETNFITLQKTILKIWQETLNLNDINVNASFFELGGHSLSAIRIVNKVKELLNKSIKITDLYNAATVTELAEIVFNAPEVNLDDKIVNQPKHVSAWVPLTDFQFVIWISNIFQPEVKKLNIVARKRLQGQLDLDYLNLALQNVIANNDVFSYKINNLFPLQKKIQNTPITWETTSLKTYPEQDMETYLNQSLEKLVLTHKWTNKRSLLIAKLFYLSNNRLEMQIAMPHLISDQQSIDIFFKNLSDAYINIIKDTQQKNTFINKPFSEFAQKEYHNIQHGLKADENFWLAYLQDASLFDFPKKYVLSCKNKTQLTCNSVFALSEMQIKTWKEFCITHTLTLNDLLAAGICLSLKEIFAGQIDIPEQLFINTVKSTREDPIFDNVIGCFIKAHPIKIGLKNKHSLIALAKDAQYSNTTTASHQYASSLIKFSSIGNINCAANRLKNLRIAILVKLYSQIFKKAHNLNLPIINACKRLARIDSNRGFLININIWQNFFNTANVKQICGNTCQEIPNLEKNISAIKGVLEICLMRDDFTNQAYLVISANLQASIREIIGSMLLKILNNAQKTTELSPQ